MKPYLQKDNCTLYLGDCREIVPQLSGFDFVLSDPPYGMNYRHGAEKQPHASRFNEVTVIGDDKPFDPEFLLGFARVALWGGNHYADKLPPSAGWLVWDKRCNTVVNHQPDCEMAWTNWLTTARIFYHVWDGFRRGSEKHLPRTHPTQKPVALMEWCLGFAPDAKHVLDPFAGSGPVMEACRRKGICYTGIEIHEPYLEVIARRLEQGSLFLGESNG